MLIETSLININFFQNITPLISYKKSLNTKYFKGMIYKKNQEFEINTATDYIFENPDILHNSFFHKNFRQYIYNNFEYWEILLERINYKSIFTINEKGLIIDFYYKVIFIAKNKKSKIYRITPNGVIKDFNKNTYNDMNSFKSNIIKSLFNVSIENDFIYDEYGLKMIEILYY